MTEETSKSWHDAMAELNRKYPRPTDGMNDEEREAYYEERRLERWAEAHEIEARVPGLDWGPEEAGHQPPYGGGCPWQAEGWLGSRPFYARYRGNTAAITIFNKPYGVHGEGPRPKELESAVIHPFYEPASEHVYNGVLDGVDEIVKFFERLIPEIKPTGEDNPSHYMQMSAYIGALLDAQRAMKESETD